MVLNSEGNILSQTIFLIFYCHSLKLAIEVDGSIHNKEKVKQNDTIRQLQMEQAGVNFIRFTNEEIKLKRENVICQIETYLKESIEKGKQSAT